MSVFSRPAARRDTPKRLGIRLVGIAISLVSLVLLSPAGSVAAVGESTPTTASTVPKSSAPAGASTGTERYRVVGTDGAALRLRAAPGLSAPILQRLPEGTIVTLGGGSAKQADKERWLPVQAEQIKGWVAARYLARVVALTPNVRQLPAGSPVGERIAATAEALVGQPYVWAGAAPGGFDCSGLVQWAYNKAGVRLPRTIEEQLTAGRRVEPGALQAGDLVSFKDTYQPGLSHVGIYVGRDRFIHAADEAQGVTMSNLRDEYWKQRFHAAVRLGG